MAKADNKDDKEKVNLNLIKTNVRKLKYISAVEDKFQGDIVDEVLTEYISNWEKVNGKIKLK